MRRFRVAHVITRLCTGGAQESTFHSVRLANRDRFEVDLISGPTDGAEGSIEAKVKGAGIPILRAPRLLRDPAPFSDAATLRRLTCQFREARYDIVHTHTSKAGFLGRIAARRAGVPIVVHTPHGNVFHGYFGPLKSKAFVLMERYAARLTDRLIELTPVGVEEHLREGIGTPAQFRVVFSGIDTRAFEEAGARRQAMRQALGFSGGEILVGGVGRLEPIKGFAYFVDAALAAAPESAQLRFLHAGQGSLDAALRARAAALGDRFRFLGPREDIPELMAALDILVAPSLNEGMGRVVLEAGAAGVPVIASRVGGIPDIVEERETGLLVTPGDTTALAAAILGLAADAGGRKRMRKTAQASIVPHYSLDSMVRKIEAIYEELIHDKGLDSGG